MLSVCGPARGDFWACIDLGRGSGVFREEEILKIWLEGVSINRARRGGQESCLVRSFGWLEGEIWVNVFEK